MTKNNILDLSESLNFNESVSLESDSKNKNKERWSKVLGTFDLIKDKPLTNNKRRASKTLSARKSVINPKESTSSKRRSILSTSFTNINKNRSNKVLDESDIVWSSSNEESDDCPDVTITNISRCTNNLIDIHNETEITWSSDSETNSTQKINSSLYQKQIDSEYELNSFIQEIKKDLRRTQKIKQKCTTKKGGFADSFRKAMNKAKSDLGFLDYEQRAEIICGVKGVIVKNEKSYGSSISNVQLEDGTECKMFLGKNSHSSVEKSNIVCFLDDTNYYTVNGKNVYIQPNKVLRV